MVIYCKLHPKSNWKQYLLIIQLPVEINSIPREDNGYILTVGGTRIYIAGDTEDIPEMKQIKNIDIAFLPVNQPYTMTPEQAIQSAKTIQPHILYPYHYGDTNINEVKDGLKNEKEIEVRIRALQ